MCADNFDLANDAAWLSCCMKPQHAKCLYGWFTQRLADAQDDPFVLVSCPNCEKKVSGKDLMVVFKSHQSMC